MVRIQEAERVAPSVPFEGSVTIFRALLIACRVQRDKETGKCFAEKPFSLDPSNATTSVMLNSCNQILTDFSSAYNIAVFYNSY